MRGFGPALVKEAAGEGDKAGRETGKRFGKAMVVGVAAVGAAALAAGTALYKVGEVFDDVTDTIRVGTGATGKDLEGLVDVAKQVGTKVPASFEDIGSVVADVNTRMGLSGETLDKVASQYLEAGRILGEEVDIMKTGAAFNAFKIEGDDVSGALDHLFRVSQATGIGMNELAGTVQNAAPAAQALGFSFEETAGMVGTLDKAGLNSSKMMAGLSKGLVELSKDGEKPADAFKRVVGEMEGYMKSGNDAAAMEIASKVFGTKNAPQFLQAIRDGKLEIGSLADVAGMTDDTILGAGEATMDFAEQWQIFKNKILVWLEPLASKVFGAMGDAMDVVNQSVTAFGAAWEYNDGEITSSGIPGFMERLGYLARQAFDYLVPKLQEAGDWIQRNSGWLSTLAAAIGGAVAGYYAWIGVTKAWTLVTQIANTVQKLFNGTLKANPIGLIITLIAGFVAAIVWLYKNNETARKIIDGAWNGIKNAFITVWNVLKPLFRAFGDFWTKTLAPALKNAWELVIKPVFKALGTFFKWVWDTLLKPSFNFLKSAFGVVGSSLKWTWNNILKPVFSALGSFFKWTWENVLKPAFGAVKKAWKGISDSIKYVWETFIKPVFDTFGKILKGDFVGAFQTAKDAVKKIWDDIRGVVKKPIEFVVNKVINEGLIGAFNKVTGFIDPGHKVIPEIGTVNLPAGFAAGGWTGPGAKYTPAGIVHADEFVVKKSSRRRFERENPGLLDHVNRTGSMSGYASGGLVRPVRGGALTSGFGASRGRYPHAGLDFAVPIGTPVHAAMDGTVLGYQPTGRTGRYVFLSHSGGRNTYYGHLSQPQVSAGQQVTKGQQIGLSGNTGNSTGPHLHWETWTGGKPVNPAAYLNGAMLPEGGVSGGGGFNPLQALVDFKDSIVGRFKDAFSGGGMFADLAQGAGTKLTSDILGWFPAQMAKIGDFGQDVWGNTKDFFNGKDSDVQSAVRGVAAGYGWDSGRHWSALSKLIAKESSWNPNAQNPSSTAYGLFQFLNSTWGSYGAKTSDPAGQARAGLKYIQDRYGDPKKALAFHKKNNWYADGGLVKPSLYDNGGVLPTGLTSILNNTRKPEAILNPAQWSSVMKSIEVSRQIANHGTATTVYQIQTPQGASVDDLVGALKFEKRMSARGGVR